MERGFAMRPRERRETSEQELFRSRLDQIIDMKHALVKLGQAIDWRFLEERFGAVYTDKPGQPPLPTRLMAGLAILKHTYDLSDEALCDRWVENPYFQYFCGEEFFQHALVFDRSSLTRWRQRMGEDKLKTLLQESLAVATRTDAMKPSDLARVEIDTTVQPKAVMFPTDAKLLNRARERLVRLAKKLGVSLRQSYRRVGKLALIKHQRYAHAHQFKRANRSLRKLKTYLGRIVLSRQLIRVWVQKYEAGALDEDAQAADLLQEYEAKIAALERMVGRQALEIEFLKGALKNAPRPRSVNTSVIAGPAASPSQKDAG
jgi:transposase, IS5 family